MLTETQKWQLERGLSLLECGYYSCKSCPNHTDEQNLWTGHCWIEEGSFCPVEYSDWQDAAEFEARVTAKLARGVTYGELPCGADPDCPDERMGKYSTKKKPMVGCYMCVLRAARLAVEEEMEKEGK